jgi:hypothetical protein
MCPGFFKLGLGGSYCIMSVYDVCGNDSRRHIHQIEINIAAQINTFNIVANPEHDMF